MLLYLLQNPRSPVYERELSFRLPVPEFDSVLFVAELVRLGCLYEASRRIKKEKIYYAINPGHVPFMRQTVVNGLTPEFTSLAESYYLRLGVLYPPYALDPLPVSPRDRPIGDSAYMLRELDD